MTSSGPPADPVVDTPVLRAGMVRRTSHIDVIPADGRSWASVPPVELEAGARDVAMGEPAASGAATLDEARLSARVNPDREIERVWLSDVDAIGSLAGLPATRGFRSRALGLLGESESVRAQLLRDLPTAVVILRGYADMHGKQAEGHPRGEVIPPGVLPHVQDVCTGFRSGGAAARSIAAGHGVPTAPPPQAPALDARGWHGVSVLAPRGLRRLRRLDLTEFRDEIVVDAAFRDTFVDGHGTERVIHEYGVCAWFDTGLVLREVGAIPRVLPFEECPVAADNVDALVGARAGEIRDRVDADLGGTSGCTHLSDLLACLDDVLALRDRIAA